jgi:S1-C subfamily serine protease
MVRLSRILLLAVWTLLIMDVSMAQKTTKKPTPKPDTSTALLPFGLARKATVAVAVQTISGPVIIGSAVWVGKNGYLATCEHVVRNLSGPILVGMGYGPYLTTGDISITIGGTMNAIEATVAASDQATDVAILKASRTPDQFFGQLVGGILPSSTLSATGATLNAEFPSPGETLLLAGYPLNEKVPILQTSTATGMAFPREVSPDGLRIMLSVVSNPGNSGGPVFDSKGTVVGLLEGNMLAPIRDENNRTIIAPRAKLDPTGRPITDARGNPIFELAPLEQNSGISFAVPAKYILKLAKEKAIPLE